MGKKDAAALATPAPTPSQRGVEGGDLSTINAWLTDRTLTPLTSAGVQTDGWNVTGVGSGHENRWYWVVELLSRTPRGRTRMIPMRSMANTAHGGRGCVLVITVNDELVVTVCQLRLPLMRYTTELPRAFATGEVVTTILDRRLKQAIQGTSDIDDEVLLVEARNLLGRETRDLLTQPGIRVEEIRSLGNLSEWAESLNLPEVILVRLSHPDLEALERLDLGPEQMKIRLYPLSELLGEKARTALGVQDQASISALALARTYFARQGRVIHLRQRVSIRFTPPSFVPLTDPAHRRLMNALNKRLRRLGNAPFTQLGVAGPAGTFLGVGEDPWFRCRAWMIMRFEWCRHADERLPFFIRDLRRSRWRHEEALMVIVNGTHLLTIRAHHLPFLTDKDPKRAWCNRTSTLLADTKREADSFSQLLGETEARLRVREPGGALIARTIRAGSVAATELLSTLHEDTGVSRITRPIRCVHLRLEDASHVIQTMNARAPRRARLALVPIAEAIQDPEAYGIRDQQSLSILLTAAENIGALS